MKHRNRKKNYNRIKNSEAYLEPSRTSTMGLKVLCRANGLIPNNYIRSVILEIKTTDVKSLKY